MKAIEYQECCQKESTAHGLFSVLITELLTSRVSPVSCLFDGNLTNQFSSISAPVPYVATHK